MRPGKKYFSKPTIRRRPCQIRTYFAIGMTENLTKNSGPAETHKDVLFRSNCHSVSHFFKLTDLCFLFWLSYAVSAETALSRWANWASWSFQKLSSNEKQTENWDLIISWSLFWFDQLRHLILRSAKRLEFRKFANNFYGYIPLWPEWFIPSQKWKLQQSCECKYILFCFNTSRKNERDT